MFNMKTSDLFKRAKQLADLEGSDFISWNEAINCINESNVGLYEKLINMGDNSFVKDFHITDKEMELPSDFWQLKGVYLWNNGNRQIINRRADSDGIHHLSYELRNGKIYLFGNPNDVYVEYFPKPEKLYFPPNCVSIGLDTTKTYLDCHKHTFLYEDTDSENNETLSIIDLDGIKTKKDFIQISHSNVERAYITDNYIFIIEDTIDFEMTIYDIMSGYSASLGGFAPLITESGKEFIVSTDGVVFYFQVGDDSNITRTMVKDAHVYTGEFNICDDNFEDFYLLRSDGLYHNDTLLEDVENLPKYMTYSKGKCFCLGNTGFFVIKNDKVKIIENSTGVNVGFIGIDERTGFGYCSKKYGAFYVNPYCEDTPLEYPNSTYFQIIAYILAIMFKAKQGADVSLLSSQLQMAEQTFEDTLGNDAFQFTRMGNVYN